MGRGLSWRSRDWESACQCREHGFDSWSRKIPHATEQLSLCAMTTEPVCCNYGSLHILVPSPHTSESVLCTERPPQQGDRVPQQTSPRLLQLDRAHAKHRTPRAAVKSPNCGYFKGKEFSRVGSRTDFYFFFFFFFFVKGHRFKKFFIMKGKKKGLWRSSQHPSLLSFNNEESQVSKC